MFTILTMWKSNFYFSILVSGEKSISNFLRTVRCKIVVRFEEWKMGTFISSWSQQTFWGSSCLTGRFAHFINVFLEWNVFWCHICHALAWPFPEHIFGRRIKRVMSHERTKWMENIKGYFYIQYKYDHTFLAGAFISDKGISK